VTLLAGAAEGDITPPFPVDLLGYVRRPLAARSAYGPLMATAVVFRDGPVTVVIIGADVVGLTTEMADRIRVRVGDAVECDPAAVLLSSSHTHAAPWPGATIKLGGEFDGWTDTELRYWDSIRTATPPWPSRRWDAWRRPASQGASVKPAAWPSTGASGRPMVGPSSAGIATASGTTPW